MNHFFKYCAIILLFFSPGACLHNAVPGTRTYNFIVSVPPEIFLENKTVESFIREKSGRFDRNSPYTAEILVLHYTSGREVMTISSRSSGIVTNNHAGTIDALLKIRRSNEIQEVHFLRAAGKTRAKILENLLLEIIRVLR